MSSTQSQRQQNLNNLIFAPGATIPFQRDTPTTQPSNQAAQFTLSTLHRSHLHPDPFVQFHTWFNDPRLTNTVPETCCLSTASLPSGRVSARMVYLKTLETASQTKEPGFVIYSNFGDTSQKSHDLKSNPHASLTFWFKSTERQVRIEGTTERLTPEESQVYFDTRARGSRIGAWASRQSAVLLPSTSTKGQERTEKEDDDGRAVLDQQVTQTLSKFSDRDHIPVPPFWGGLRLVPDTIEFWQGRESRLHDRFRYTLLSFDDDDPRTDKKEDRAGDDDVLQSVGVDGAVTGSGSGKRWKIERLSP